MRIYLDICCFNRPFDAQLQLRVRLEAESKLEIQHLIRIGSFELIWSYMMDYENSANPFHERRSNTLRWKKLATSNVMASESIITRSKQFNEIGIKKKDSLHLACAIEASCEMFFTTDKGVLRKKNLISAIAILNPVEYIIRND